MIEVPLWGVSGVVEVFVDGERNRIARSGTPRRPIPPTAQTAAEPVTIVIDARGQSVDPTLFPTLVDERCRVIYDMNSAARATAGRRPVVRYAVSDLPLDRIGMAIDRRSSGRVLLASYQVDPPKAPPIDAPTSDAKPRRRPRRAVGKIAAFRSKKYDGRFHIAEQTYRKMVKTPGFEAAVKNADVIIVVDAPAAGREARRRVLDHTIASAVRITR